MAVEGARVVGRVQAHRISCSEIWGGIYNVDVDACTSALTTSIYSRSCAGGVEGPLTGPTSIYDLKTGSATLTPGRIQQIHSHIPGGINVPVNEVRP